VLGQNSFVGRLFGQEDAVIFEIRDVHFL
jgi:hypothetical protein